MSDVAINVHTGVSQAPGNVYIIFSPNASGQVIQPKFYQKFPISGDGLDDNGYLDNRFDDPTYYDA